MTTPVLEWAVRSRPIDGAEVSGDRALVRVHGPSAVAAAIDGLGHGSAAAMAAERAADALAGRAEADVAMLVERCHEVLARTRGAALSVASLDGSADLMKWLGVGNVEGRVVRASKRHAAAESLLLTPGVVGHELPQLRASSTRLQRGDLLLFATDGVDPAFADVLDVSGSCAAIADRVLERHGRRSDDALVLVVRYLGGRP
jgi:negative regulator of sigma-B (phosphoserine phosphatase)